MQVNSHGYVFVPSLNTEIATQVSVWVLQNRTLLILLLTVFHALFTLQLFLGGSCFPPTFLNVLWPVDSDTETNVVFVVRAVTENQLQI